MRRVSRVSEPRKLHWSGQLWAFLLGGTKGAFHELNQFQWLYLEFRYL